MTRELNWVFDQNHDLANSSDYLVLHRELFYYLKNQLVALGGWEVVGSSSWSGGDWEYEGVTAGGSYGGGSTGPYDVWVASSSISRNADGSYPSWMVLKGPTWKGATPYLIMAYVGTYDGVSQAGACEEKPELIDASNAYVPVAPSANAGFVEFKNIQWFGSSGNIRTQLSVCVDSGSFVLVGDRQGYTGFQSIFSLVRLVPTLEPSASFGMAFGGGANSPFDSIYINWWKAPIPTPQPWGDTYPLIADPIGVTWGEPVRQGGTTVLTTDMPTVNCFGKVDGFPFYLVIGGETGNIEYKPAWVGRVPDMMIAPDGLSDGDTVGDGGSVEYYVCGHWLIPGNVTPIVL